MARLSPLLSAAFAAAVLSPSALAQAPVQSEAKANEATAARRAPRYPSYATVEGQPVETRPPEKKDDHPLFPGQTRAPYRATTSYKVETLADDLSAPWALGFLPQGRILITERLPGAFRILDRAGALSPPVDGLAALKAPPGAQIGLLDVAIDPKFASNQRIFFTYFEWADKNPNNTFVATARLDPARGTLSDVRTIFRAAPDLPAKGDISAGTKSGGRIAIGRDGYLYVLIGDRDGAGAHPWDVAQRLDNHLGKVIRITVDGKPAPGNPFIGQPGALPEIWAYGQRSQEGLAFDPASGKLWETEHGPRGGDELNLIEKGKNYGWPVITHGLDYSGAPVGDGIVARDGMAQPVYYWDPVIAPSGLAFYQGRLFPQWRGSLFVGGLRGMLVDRLKLVNGRVVEEEPLLTDLHLRIRDVRVGPDGAVYVLTDSGGALISENTPKTAKLLRIVPK
ncbi:PQQ-dependent sugar dehydrogenase [Sphingomonas quercus]|uniref:PQQ-dependent sugar dehydrogenase n=1 Tax=Sphingomonas quercus TaxID=2842451 RepID=A0ABS6BIH9_9SPHN|nr:PQQ-dependent sugar dehydrogenase [Sphingomonas quercus]MBU3077407.1 PQQ-dependent sugar dehydrogenase [Sphingomonas quercus]